MDVPDIPSVNLKTSYLQLKDIIEEIRKVVTASHMVDSPTVRIVDNPGGTRSAVVFTEGKFADLIGPTGPTGPTGF